MNDWALTAEGLPRTKGEPRDVPASPHRHGAVGFGLRARSSIPVLLLALAGGGGLGSCGAGGGGSSGGGGGTAGEDGGDGSLLPPGSTVTELRTVTPYVVDEFLLHATVPVPRGAYPPADGSVPFRIEDYDGTVVDTQVEIVSRYPNADDGADVVEVIGRVRADPAIAAGQDVTYRLVAATQPAPADPGPAGLEDLVEGPSVVPESVQTFLADSASLRISAFDCFGHEYRCNPLDGSGEMRVERYGPNQAQIRVYQVMTPVEPDPSAYGTLSHSFGVHAYLSTYTEEPLVGLDLRFHNAHCGDDASRSTDDPLDKLYFERIEVAVPTGWSLRQEFDDPFFGDPYTADGEVIYPIVKPNDDGTMHVIRWQGQFHRRLMLSPAGEGAAAYAYLHSTGQAFASRGFDEGTGLEYYSWWNRGTARYFPQSFQLPRLDHLGWEVRQRVTNDFDFLTSHLENGTNMGDYPVWSGVLGWGHPYGVSYGGMTGGSEIHINDGIRVAWSAAPQGIPYFHALHRMQTDRMPNAMYGADGEPTTVEDWMVVQNGWNDYVPFEHFHIPKLDPGDPFGFDQAERFQIQHVEGAGLKPDYHDAHLSFDPYDYQHYIRMTRGAKVLAWLANDPIAKDDLRLAAEMFNLSYHQYLNNAWGGIQGSGLRATKNYTTNNPGKGTGFGRGTAWGLDCANAAYALSSPEWRATKRPWLDEIALAISAGQIRCSGFIQSAVIPKFLNARYHARQAIEQSITENAFRGMLMTVYRDTDPAMEALVEDMLEESLYAFVSKMAWFPGETAPWSHTAVGPLDSAASPWCSYGQIPADGYEPVYEAYQNWSSFAYGYERTGDSLFLDKASLQVGGDLLYRLEQNRFNNLANMAPILALAQRLNGDM